MGRMVPSLNVERIYVGWDEASPVRGVDHAARIKANDRDAGKDFLGRGGTVGAEVKREVGPELFEGDVAPLTRQLLFVNAPLKRVVRQQLSMSKEFGKVAKARRAPRQLRQALMTLEPLCLSGDRNLFFATQNPQWTAVWSNLPRGNDGTNPMYALAIRLGVPGLSVGYSPDVQLADAAASRRQDGGDQLGARTWRYYTPLADGSRLVSRSLYLARQSGKRWHFDAGGPELPFEDVEAYSERKLLDRLTPQMLADYSAALGVRPFDEDFYSGPGFMVEESNPRRLIAESRGQRPVLERYTLAEARTRLGLGVVFPSEVSQPATVDTFEDIDDLALMRSALPVQVSTVTPKPGGAYLKGPGWYMEIDCDAVWQGGAALGADDWAGLAGDTLTGVDGPADLFDPTLTFASGKIVVLDAGDESPPWYFVSGDVEIDAPGYNSHQDWLAGNIGDEV